MAEILELLHRDHANMAKLLDILEDQVERFEKGALLDFDIVEGVADYAVSYPELCHHPKENLIYDRLLARHPQFTGDIADLREEHERLSRLSEKFSALTRQVLQEAMMPREWFGRVAREFIDLNRRHMVMEERHMFPAAAKLLEPEEWDAIDAQVERRDDPLFSEKVEKRFAALRTNVLAWAQEQQA